MKKVLGIFLISLLLGSLLLGCAPKTPVGQMNEYKKLSQINNIKTNQQSIAFIFNSLYAELGRIPSDDLIDKQLNNLGRKTLEEMQISIIRNEDGSFNISNTDPDFSKEEVPDIAISNEEIEF